MSGWSKLPQERIMGSWESPPRQTLCWIGNLVRREGNLMGQINRHEPAAREEEVDLSTFEREAETQSLKSQVGERRSSDLAV
ncbi:unnamed protein product [Arabis nemorensis]|uniref:Uncharacterized protein n=1 Tax=Arabis nemorensis TaxID=586526 RepID=A0A565C5U5_9BRAS|nr:unnamed protein product [Arabis nemorensis]